MSELLNLWNIGAALLIIDWSIRIWALFIVPRNRKPSSATSWLMVIFLLPIPGVILYLLLGNPKLPEHRQASQRRIDNVITDTIRQFKRSRDTDKLLSAKAPEMYEPLSKLCFSLTCLPVFDGNKIELQPDYQKSIDELVKDIDSAQTFVHLEYFIMVLDETTEPLFEAMARAVQRGVIVRVMYDDISTRRFPGKRKMDKRLKADGIFVRSMLPITFSKGYVRPDLRNHRKIAVIDGHTGYVGSQNLIQRNYHRRDDIYYDELVSRIQGPIVLQLSSLFSADWYSETGELLKFRKNDRLPSVIDKYGSSLAQILPSGPGYDDENNLKLFTELVHLARKKIIIVNPYFVPDEALLTAITSAAKRGVEIVMINSEAIDQWMVGHAQRSFYETLLGAGVKINLYKSPILLHSKFITVDGQVATIGSSNLDIRSFELDLEVTLISYDTSVTKKLDVIAASYLKKSKPITLSQWHKRSRKKLLLENLARLTSALQ